jgi:malate synthase
MQTTHKFDDIEVDSLLYAFLAREALPGTELDSAAFFAGFAALVRRFAPRNAALLAKRDRLQASIDAWHREHPGADFDAAAYRAHLLDIGYLVPEGVPFSVDTDGVDPEIARVAGPQLVVPVSNARYALNAANARWGSLYDALYGTDAIPGAAARGAYDPQRGAQVIAYARQFLDDAFPLTAGTHRDAVGYRVAGPGLEVAMRAAPPSFLETTSAFAGYQGDPGSPSVILLEHHGLHVELHIDRRHLIGKDDPAGISDIVLESAVTTIQDCEDSVAAVTAAEKVNVYRNWLGLMRGTLEARIDKGATSAVRRLNADREYTAPGGERRVLPGRSLMLVRNVGHHMMSDSVTLRGSPVPETFIDLVVTSLAALHDLRGRPAESAAAGNGAGRPAPARRLPTNCSPPPRISSACRAMS